jgi:hypothetical protein
MTELEPNARSSGPSSYSFPWPILLVYITLFLPVVGFLK